jgi:hypothetical protein
MNFQYPTQPHQRRHGPQGYRDPASYKPWLRDEFSFACVFCLLRESWFPADLGPDAFSVEHHQPQSLRPDLVCIYDNLLYVCNKCNSRKGVNLVPDPCHEPYGSHLMILENGSVAALTAEGRKLIQLFHLNRKELSQLRLELLELLRTFHNDSTSESATRLRKLMSFPDNLPDLAALRPPGGNSRPAGVANCYFALRQRGELPETY